MTSIMSRQNKILCILTLAAFFALPSAAAAQPGKIVFHTSRDGVSQIFSMNPDGTNHLNPTNFPLPDLEPSSSGGGLAELQTN